MGLESSDKKKNLKAGLHKALQAALLGGVILTTPAPAARESVKEIYATEDSSMDGELKVKKGAYLSQNVEDQRFNSLDEGQEIIGGIISDTIPPARVEPSMARDIEGFAKEEKLRERALEEKQQQQAENDLVYDNTPISVWSRQKIPMSSTDAAKEQLTPGQSKPKHK